MPDPDTRILPSVLSRLTDTDSAGTSWQYGYEMADMTAAVQRDLEDLLNTPRPYPEIPEGFAETRDSIAGYGLPELVSRSASTPDEQARLAEMLQDAVSRFEPRLREVRAEVLPTPGNLPGQVRVRIKAQLCVDPAPEVAFDTILELTTGRCSVKPGG
jgi:type VI secretion system protein ImpF